MARHLAICERKSAYPSRSDAKSATVTHSMLDVLGLVRKPEEGPSGIKRKSIVAKQEPNVADDSIEISHDNELERNVEKARKTVNKAEKDITDDTNQSDAEIEEIIEDTDKVAEKTNKEKEVVADDAEKIDNEELNETEIQKGVEKAASNETVEEKSDKIEKSDAEEIVTTNLNAEKETGKSDEEKADEEDIETAVSSEAEDTEKQDEEEITAKVSSGVEEETAKADEEAVTVSSKAEGETVRADKEGMPAASIEVEEAEEEAETENIGLDVIERDTEKSIEETKSDENEKDKELPSTLTKNYIETQDEVQSTEEQKLVQNALDIQSVGSHIEEEASATYEKEAEVPKESAAIREQISPINEMETSEVIQEKVSLESEITSDDIQNLISDVVGEKSHPSINFEVQNMDELASMETETDITAFAAGEDSQGLSSRQIEDVTMQISQDESMEVPETNEVMDCEVVSPMETD